MSVLRLYNYIRSSASYRARIALNLKGITAETVDVDLREPAEQNSPAYLAVNPQGLVPALVVGEDTVAQSLAILEYLEETHPEPPLLPKQAVARARVRAMSLAVACDMHPLNNLRVLKYLRSPLGHDENEVNSWYRHWISVGFNALEQDARRASGDGLHMFGTSVTMADVCIVPQMFNARRFKCDTAPYPTLRAICAHLESLPAFAQAAPPSQ